MRLGSVVQYFRDDIKRAQCFVVAVMRLLFRDYSVLTATKVVALLIVCNEAV